MKSTLAYNSAKGLFRCDVGNPSKRFYLGGDRRLAQQRKEAIVRLWETAGVSAWTDDLIVAAHSIRKGETVQLRHEAGETEAQYLDREERLVRAVASVSPISPAVTSSDYVAALHQEIEQLKALVRQHVGAGAVEGPTVTVHAALDAWCDYRRKTEINPETGKPTEGTASEARSVALLKRLISDMPLSRLSWTQLNSWCKALSNRPKSLKTGKPIRPETVRNGLKVLRRALKWVSRNYGVKLPDDWTEATRVMPRRTADERHEQIAALSKHYTPEEIGVLWRYARPDQRILILLALNMGFAQAEIRASRAPHFQREETAAIRGKSGAIGRWIVWPETRAICATEFGTIPKTTQGIANKWKDLVDRVRRDLPDFRWLSFKWLRKTGSSLIRKIAGAEISSLYISHGERATSDDDLLNKYADQNWDQVCSALRTLREQLLPHLQAEAPPTGGHVSVGKYDAVRAAWASGMKAEDVARAAGVSIATAYRHRP